MTRINCVPVEELHDKHLIAEYRELPRVFKLARPDVDKPEKYVLGKGHIKFFYDKLHYLYTRQKQLVKEMKDRGFNPKFDPDYLVTADACPYHGLYKSWVPDEEAIELNRSRIRERLIAMGVNQDA